MLVRIIHDKENPMDDLKQPEALRLADALDELGLPHYAAELRRLSVSEREGWRYADELEQERKRLETANAELLEALKEVRRRVSNPMLSHAIEADIDAAIAKHGGSHD